MRKGTDQCRQFIRDLVLQYKEQDKIVHLVVRSVMEDQKLAPPALDQPLITPKKLSFESHWSLTKDSSEQSSQVFTYHKVEIEQPKPMTELFNLIYSLDLVGLKNEPLLGWEHKIFVEGMIIRTLQKAMLYYSGRPNACSRELCLQYDSLSDMVRQLLVLFEVTRPNQRHKSLVTKEVLDIYLLVRSGGNDRLKTMLQPSQSSLMVVSQWSAEEMSSPSKSSHLYALAVAYILSIGRGQFAEVSDHQEEFWSSLRDSKSFAVKSAS